MRLVFAGTPEAAVPALRALLESRHEVAAVVTRPDARSGRGRKLGASPVAAVAEEHGVEVLKPVRPSDLDFLSRLTDIGPQCCPVVAYGALLPAAALDIPRHGWVNLHFSLLPAWRGAAPVQRALIAGDEVTGATTFRIVEALDAGPTYGLLTEPVTPDDTAGTLLERLAHHGAGLLTATLDGIEAGTLVARPQPADGLSLAPKLTVDDAEIDWAAPAFAIDRRIRACTPAPGAWTVMGESRLKIAPPTMLPALDTLGAGQVVADKETVTVGTGTHAVRLTDVQPAGKPWTPAADWARGLRDMPRRLGR